MMESMYRSDKSRRERIAAALVLEAQVVNMLFDNRGMTEDELLAYINQLTGYDDGLTNLVCFMLPQVLRGVEPNA